MAASDKALCGRLHGNLRKQQSVPAEIRTRSFSNVYAGAVPAKLPDVY